MANVYFKRLNDKAQASEIAGELLAYLVEHENIALESRIALKVHFGEKGNKTYLKPENYEAIIDFLQKRGCECSYIETNVLYGGERYLRSRHLKLAESHGFTQLPIIIADGERGEESTEVEINRKHFRQCSLGRAFDDYRQVVVLSHFKGHTLAGFGGAIKQLSMGFASKGGKLAMHMGVKPRIIGFMCKRCKLCQTRCQVNAITIGKKSFIDHHKCIGCGACFSICPHKAISIFSLAGLVNALFKGKFFREKLVEYAYASDHTRKNLYISFAMNVTSGCDCEPRTMKPCVPDLGIFASTDPVAIDTACYDAALKAGKKFRGYEQLVYGEKIGLGSRDYRLVELTSGE